MVVRTIGFAKIASASCVTLSETGQSLPYLQITPAKWLQIPSRASRPAQRTGRERLSCMHRLFTMPRKWPGCAAEDIYCARYYRRLHAESVGGLLQSRPPYLRFAVRRWREWSSLELQLEKLKRPKKIIGRDFYRWVSALLAFSRHGIISCIQGSCMARTADCGLPRLLNNCALETLGGTFSAIHFIATSMSLAEYQGRCRFQTGWRIRNLYNRTWRKHGDPEVDSRSSSDDYLSEDDRGTSRVHNNGNYSRVEAPIIWRLLHGMCW